MSKAHAATAPLQSIEATVLDRDLAALPLEPWPAFPPEDILAGDPNTHRGTVLYRDPTQLYSIGVWCCPKGKFQVVYGGTEFAHVITGHATLTDVKTGVARDLKVGDHFFVPMGSEMIWDVHEEFRKATRCTRPVGSTVGFTESGRSMEIGCFGLLLYRDVDRLRW